MDRRNSAFSESDEEVEGDSSFSRGCLDTRLRTESGFSGIGEQWEQAKSYYLGVKSPFKDDLSFKLTDSFVFSLETETMVTIALETEGAGHRDTVPPGYTAPFEHKPQFTRRNSEKKQWKRALIVIIPEECEEFQVQSPACENAARYPKPSMNKWERGTKRGYENEYYYRDVEADM